MGVVTTDKQRLSVGGGGAGNSLAQAVLKKAQSGGLWKVLAAC